MTDRQPPAAASLPTPDDRGDATEERAALLTAYALGQLDAALEGRSQNEMQTK